jgi:hypothetical protein
MTMRATGLRLSGERRNRSSSVSFDAKVSILIMDPPKENCGKLTDGQYMVSLRNMPTHWYT